MFSKPAPNIEVLSEEKNRVITALDYNDYYKKEVSLEKMKVPELKKIAKQHKMLVSGRKAILIERIKTRFREDKNAGLIQNIYKGYVVRKLLNGIENDISNRSFVNETDFYTLEPLSEISRELFFSYKDDDQFEYGFNIISLLLMMKNSKKIQRFVLDLKLINVMIQNTNLVDIKNPYNRSKIDRDVVVKILKRVILINMIFPHHLNDVLQHNVKNQPTESILRTYNYLSNTEILRNNYRDRINQLREKSLDERIQNIFMEIDNLGNYTQSSWFSELNREDCIRLYRHLYEIWNYRGQISRELRHKICILIDPFREIHQQRLTQREITGEFIKEACLKVFEYMVLTGIDDEHRKLGALHALSALTIVSRPARHSMPWLFESLGYGF